jgi:hypothetical protein
MVLTVNVEKPIRNTEVAPETLNRSGTSIEEKAKVLVPGTNAGN